ncbi:hypothetical protein M0R04_13825 [Candidatus Dojkabacteria bacterium]|jgi:hypothetical protein|nr:hypothetical protein [Candidatus Dojkabacteria bacterium]
MEQELLQRINKLEKEIQDLKSFATIPFLVEGAFRERLGINLISPLIISSKVVSSENITAVTSVDFVGQSVGTNSVLDNPDGFLQVIVSGTTYYIPVYT